MGPLRLRKQNYAYNKRKPNTHNNNKYLHGKAFWKSEFFQLLFLERGFWGFYRDFWENPQKRHFFPFSGIFWGVPRKIPKIREKMEACIDHFLIQTVIFSPARVRGSVIWPLQSKDERPTVLHFFLKFFPWKWPLFWGFFSDPEFLTSVQKRGEGQFSMFLKGNAFKLEKSRFFAKNRVI